MGQRSRLAVLLLGVLLAAPAGRTEIREPWPGPATADSTPPMSVPSPERLPVAFEPNLGQYDPAVDGAGRGGGVTAYLGARGMLLAADGGGSGWLEFRGARGTGRWTPLDVQPGRNHHFRGRDPARWVRGVPRYRRMILEEPWPGVTAEMRGDAGRLAYGFRVEAGADPGAIRLGFPGSTGIRETADGGIQVEGDGCRFRHTPPLAWQEIDGRRASLPVRFLRRGAEAGFDVRGRDPTRPLFIDPRIEASSYLGGPGTEEGAWGGASNQVYALEGRTVAADGAGSMVVVGRTGSVAFPIKNAFQDRVETTPEGFIIKFAVGTLEVAFCTFIGGSRSDAPHAVDIGSDGGIAVAVETNSFDFPLTPDAYQQSVKQYEDLAVLKLSADGSTLLMSTLLSGGRSDLARGVAALDDGSVVILAHTDSGLGGSAALPTAKALQQYYLGGYDAYLARVSSDGKSLLWGTYMGGSGTEQAGGLGVDASGFLLIAGYTDSQDFPVVSALKSTNSGGKDAFVVRMDPAGPSVQSATYFGGSGDDAGTCVDVDAQGGVLLGGNTKSDNFPVLFPVQATRAGMVDAFLVRFKGDLSATTFGTYLGGSADDPCHGVVGGAGGRVFLGGMTWSGNFPLVAPLQTSRRGLFDVFLARISTLGGGLTMSTYLGGADTDYLRGMAPVSPGTVLLAGWTLSQDWPTLGGEQMSSGGQEDAFYTQVTLVPSPPRNPSAEAMSSSLVEVRWGVGSNDESGFEVQRRSGAGPWVAIHRTAAGASMYADGNALGSTTYTYRIRSFNEEGESAFTPEATATTPEGPPGPPVAPAGVAATVQSPRSVLLAWEDRSDSEDSFVISRRTPAGTFAPVSSVGAGTTAWVDGTVLPGSAYVYSLRAANVGGFSLPTSGVAVEMPATLDVSLARGKARDSAVVAKDALKISGTLALGEGAAETGLDPGTRAVQVRFGAPDGPVLLAIPAGDEGWRERRGTWTWKSPKGGVTKAALKFAPARGAFALSLSRCTIPAPMEESAAFFFRIAGEGGSAEGAWTEAKPGLWKLP